MPSNHDTEITLELLNTLENRIRILDVNSEKEFEQLREGKKAIVYMHVNWSAQERISRYVVYQALLELQLEKTDLFKIDGSFVEEDYLFNWLKALRKKHPDFLYTGKGETLFFEYGDLQVQIDNPGLLSIKQVKEIFNEWSST